MEVEASPRENSDEKSDGSYPVGLFCGVEVTIGRPLLLLVVLAEEAVEIF